MASTSGASCSLSSEQHRFREKCAHHIRRLDAMRAQTRHRRGLAISLQVGFGTYNASGLGIGHTLLVAYKLFDLCVSLRRYCYLSLYDSHIEKFFTYPDGARWAIDAKTETEELRLYKSSSTVRWRVNFHERHKNLSELQGTLESRIACQYPRCKSDKAVRLADTPLIRLAVIGWPPLDEPHSFGVLGTAERAARAQAASGKHASSQQLASTAVAALTPARFFLPPGLHPCRCRYLTTPDRAKFVSSGASGASGTSLLAPWEGAIAPQAAVHLRTSFADAWNETHLMLRYGAPLSATPSAAAAAKWLDAACPEGTAWLQRPKVRVFSDSPGLLRELQRRRSGSFGTGLVSSRASTEAKGFVRHRRRRAHPSSGTSSSHHHPSLDEATTRTWSATESATRAALADVVVAALSQHLYVAPQLHRCVGMRGCKNTTADPHHWHWSSFFRPLLLRSFCIDRLALAVPGCSRYPATFVRDLPGHLQVALGPKAGQARYRIMQTQFWEAHPCKGVGAPHECYRQWVGALI